AFDASTSRSRGGALVTRESRSSWAACATWSTARLNAGSLALDGRVKPLSFRTNCREEARISSFVAGGLKVWSVLMLPHLYSPCWPHAASTPPAVHALQPQDRLEPAPAPLAPVPRLLVAAERRAEVRVSAVQVDVSRADPARDRARVLDVARGHVAGEPVEGVVGDLHRLLLGLVRQDRQHGAEDLLARDRHVVPHVAEDRRLDEVAAC